MRGLVARRAEDEHEVPNQKVCEVMHRSAEARLLSLDGLDMLT